MLLYYIGRTCRVSVKYSRTRTFVHLNNLDSSFGHKDRKVCNKDTAGNAITPVAALSVCWPYQLTWFNCKVEGTDH